MESRELYSEIRTIEKENDIIRDIEFRQFGLRKILFSLEHVRKEQIEKLYLENDRYRSLREDYKKCVEERNKERKKQGGSSFMGPISRNTYIEMLSEIVPEEAKDDESSCVVCRERKKCILVTPCNHKALCSVCAITILAEKHPCPLCRKKIGDVRRVFD